MLDGRIPRRHPGQLPALRQCRCTDIDSKLVFGVILPAQQVTVVLAVVYINRLKGQRSLAGDFGFRIRLSDARYLVIGAVFEVLLTLAVLPILQLDPDAKNEQLPSDLQEHRDAVTVILFFIGAVILAPRSRSPCSGASSSGGSSGRSGRSRRWSSRRRSSPWSSTSAIPTRYRSCPPCRVGGRAGGGDPADGRSFAAIFMHAGFNLTTTIIFLSTNGGPS